MSEFDGEGNREARPGFLTVLSVLSFISLGGGLVSTLISFVSGRQSDEEMLDSKVTFVKSISDLKDLGMDSFVEVMEQLQRMTDQVNENFYLALFITFITSVVGLFGVVKMWQGFKFGFHMYIGYCLLTIAGLYVYVSPANIPTVVVVWNLLLSALFIFLYSRNLKWMR
jgi:hypothetical protein